MECKTIYFDLDGVLADFDSTYTRLTGTSYEHDPTLTEQQKDEKWALLGPHPNFFLELPWMPGAKLMVLFAFQHAPHSVGICSAASRRIPQSPTQKHQWCNREIPWMPASNVVIVNRKRDKCNYVGKGNVLVDDYKLNIDRWQDAGGVGILFQNVLQTMEELQTIIKAPESMYRRMVSLIKKEIGA
jgi:5'(3')-deoxyribonucleotidase